MSAVKTDQSEGIPAAGIPEQAVKKMLTASAALSLPSPFAFFSRSFSQFTLFPLSRSLEQATVNTGDIFQFTEMADRLHASEKKRQSSSLSGQKARFVTKMYREESSKLYPVRLKIVCPTHYKSC